MEQNHDMDEIDLLELARLLWSHALQIAAAGIAAAVICLLVCTFVLTPRYQASVNLIVNSRQDGNASITSDNINSARNLIDTYAVIIKSNIVLNDVIEQLGLDMTYRQLLACVSVDGVGSTQIMSITVTNEDPALAGKIVQAIAETAPDVIVDKVEAGLLQGRERRGDHEQPRLPSDEEVRPDRCSRRHCGGLRHSGSRPPAP